MPIAPSAARSAIRKGRVALEGHAQFVLWFATQEAAEARCEMTWPGDPERRATLHVFFAHTASDGVN